MSEIDISKSQVERDWKKIVSESKGELSFIPEELLEESKKWSEKRNELEDQINKVVSKMQISTMKSLNDVMFKIREYYEKAGVADIWSKNVGFQTEALKEGIFILEIIDQKPGAR